MIKNQNKQLIEKVVKEIFPDIREMPNFSVEIPQDNKFGDYSSNIAMVLAKTIGKNPMEIAQQLKTQIEKLKTTTKSSKLFDKIEIAKPGFINFYLSPEYLQDQVKNILNQKDQFGQSDLGKDLKVNIEFISANPTGPLHIGNARGGFCGDTLANVFKAYGAKVTKEYYVNDRGKQIEDLGHSVLEDDQAVYKGEYLEKIKNQMSKIRKKNQNENIENTGKVAAKIILENHIKKTIKKMGIEFDQFYSEQSLYDRNEIEKVLGLLDNKGYLEEKDGALWFKSSQFNDDKDRVIRRSNGEYTYLASDIAYHTDKINRGYDICINYWGADHAGYAPRMEAAVNEVLRNTYAWQGWLKIIIFQLVRIIKDGKEYRMSKREGNVVYIDDLLKDVPLDVARFFFLMYSYNTHMDFDLDLAKEQSQKNPVYYVQYAHARIASILAQYQKSKIKNQNENLLSSPGGSALCGKMENLKHLNIGYELDLIKTLIKLPDIVEEIAGDYQVHRLTHYAREIADKFHSFYENCRVIDDENSAVTEARLALCEAAKIVLKNTLELMGINAPEKM